MNKNTLFNRKSGAIALSLLFLTSTQTVFAENGTNPYSSTKTIVLEDGTAIDVVVANSPATPPINIMASMEFSIAPLAAGDVVIPDVPAFDWSYGSSATAGAMIAGYYDNTGYPDMYTGPTNGGVMPLTNVSWPEDASTPEGGHECPLSATKDNLDDRNGFGHVDDYYGAVGEDPFVTAGREEHDRGDCTGDYMKTNKWFPGSSNIIPGLSNDINQDGAALFMFSGDGQPMTASDLEANGYNQYDAGYGLKLFFESRNYTITTMYNQYIHPDKQDGFSYVQYKAEINAGRPVMLHLTGHIVVGTGYNDTNGEEVIFHDSWSHVEQRMTWGGSYQPSGYVHNAVTIVTLADEAEPSTSWLPAINFLLLGTN